MSIMLSQDGNPKTLRSWKVMDRKPEGRALIPEKNPQVLTIVIRNTFRGRTKNLSRGTGEFHRPVRRLRKEVQVINASAMITLQIKGPFQPVSAGNQQNLRVMLRMDTLMKETQSLNHGTNRSSPYRRP